MRPLLAAAATLLCSPALLADGMLLGKKGLLREESQAAFIEWRAGQERLYVSTAGETPPEGGSLWIVPIPGVPGKVKAEPVAVMPRVFEPKPILPLARENLTSGIMLSMMLDTGLLPLVFMSYLGTRTSSVFSSVGSMIPAGGGGPPPGITVHEHIEKLGMTLEILSASSTSALDEYLRSKELPFKSADLHTLAPYLKQGHVLICGWAKAKLEARAMRIDFPSEGVYFPLRPSQVYKTPIATTLYVNGLAELPPGFLKPHLRVEHVLARLNPAADDPRQTLTRIILDTNPAAWSEDLLLEPGGSPRTLAADWSARLPLAGWWLISMLLGGAVSWWLPRALAAGAPIAAQDRYWAAIAGFALGFTVFAAFFAIWFWLSRRETAPKLEQERRGRWTPALAAFVLAMAHLLACVLVFGGALLWFGGSF